MVDNPQQLLLSMHGKLNGLEVLLVNRNRRMIDIYFKMIRNDLDRLEAHFNLPPGPHDA